MLGYSGSAEESSFFSFSMVGFEMESRLCDCVEWISSAMVSGFAEGVVVVGLFLRRWRHCQARWWVLLPPYFTVLRRTNCGWHISASVELKNS